MILRSGKNTQKNCTKRSSWPRWSRWCDQSPRARHPGMWSQVGLREHHFEQSRWRWWNSSWVISNPQRWCGESAALNMAVNLETQHGPQDWKRSVFTPLPKGGNAKECSNDWAIKRISHASKVMLEILQDRLQQYVNCELPDVQAAFTKGRGTRNQIANISWIIKKSKRVPEKHLFLLYWLRQSIWLCGSQ